MPPIRPQCPSGIEGLDWVTTDDGSLTLWDSVLQESYHSGCGAVAESLVVYLVNSGIYQRIAGREPTSVFEIGLGTGTNLLMTASLAEHFAARLDYWTIEKRILPPTVYKNLDLARHLPKALSDHSLMQIVGREESRLWLPRLTPPPSEEVLRLSPEHFQTISGLTEVFAQWINQISSLQDNPSSLISRGNSNTGFDSATEPFQEKAFQLSEFTTVHLLVGDAANLPKKCSDRSLNERFSAVYFDPFSPETNPDLWTEEVLSNMYQILQEGGALTSYCVKGRIRQLLQNVGFVVRKSPGPNGGKREVLRALKNTQPKTSFPQNCQSTPQNSSRSRSRPGCALSACQDQQTNRSAGRKATVADN